MWSFRLRGPKGKAAALEIAPDDIVQSFCGRRTESISSNRSSRAAAGVAKEEEAHIDVFSLRTGVTVRSGFPPRVVAYDPNDQVQKVFARNDTVVVDVADTNGAAPPTVIQGAPVKKSPARAAAAAKKQAPAKKAGIHTFGGPAQRARATARPVSSIKRKAQGEGVRLGDTLDDGEDEVADEEADNTASSEPQPKYRRTHAIHLNSKEDIELNLVNAVSSKTKDRAAKFFHTATKTALEYQYEMALANARLNAALGNRFEIHDVMSARRTGSAGGDDDRPVEMRVKFKESVRKWREETVAMLHDVELKAVLKYVLISGGETGKEMLKPFNMAQCSPRVFWSIARLYNGDVAGGLADLMPEEDWSYLDIRTRAMSKKAIDAKANEEQWKLWKQEGRAKKQLNHALEVSKAAAASKNDVVAIDEDESQDAPAASRQTRSAASSSSSSAAAAAASVKRSARAAADKTSIQRALREATARAALSRFDVAAQTADVVSAFKQEASSQKGKEAAADDGDETDTDDEAVEPTTTVYCDVCNKARILSSDEAELVDVNADSWTCAKLASAGRDGSCDAVDDEIEQITGKKIGLLLSKAHIHTRKGLANTTPAKTLKHLVDPLEASSNAILKERLTSMIDEARLDEVNDLMSEIVEDSDLLGLLELQKLGTPADLVTTPLDLIYDAVQGDDHEEVTVERVQSWREQAKDSVKKYPWLAEWRTI